MILSLNEILELRSLAETTAKEAGTLIQKSTQKKQKVEHKEGADSLAAQVVTEVDRACEALIREQLADSQKKYDLAFLGEETEDDGQRHQRDYFWCVDPLDGTLAFTERRPGYAVSIALISKSGIPMLGVVFDPVNDVLYSAAHQCGAQRNGERFWVKEDTNLLTVPCDRSLVARDDFEFLQRTFDQWSASENLKGVQYIHNAGAVMNALWAIESPPACYFKFPKTQQGGGSLWDFAATACIVQEAGGHVCDFEGKSLDLNRRDSTYMNHRGAIYSTRRELVLICQKLCL